MFNFIFYSLLIYSLFILYRLCSYLKNFFHEEKKNVDDPKQINLVSEAKKRFLFLLQSDALFAKNLSQTIVSISKDNPGKAIGVFVSFIVVLVIYSSVSSSFDTIAKGKKAVDWAWYSLTHYDNKLALERSNKALKIDPSLVEPYFIKGETFFAMGNYENAMKNYKLFLEKAGEKAKDKKYIKMYKNVGAIHFKENRYKDCKESLTHFLKSEIRDPQSENFLYNISLYTDVLGDTPEMIKQKNSKVKAFEEYYISGFKKYKHWKYLDALKDFEEFRVYYIKDVPVEKSSNGLIKKYPNTDLFEKSKDYTNRILKKKNTNVLKYVADNYDYCGEIKVKDQPVIIYSSQLIANDVKIAICKNALPWSKSRKYSNGDILIVFRKATIVIKERDNFKKNLKIPLGENTVIQVFGCDTANDTYGSEVEVPDDYQSTEFERDRDDYLENSRRNNFRFRSSPRYSVKFSSSSGGYKSSSFRGGGSSWGK